MSRIRGIEARGQQKDVFTGPKKNVSNTIEVVKKKNEELSKEDIEKQQLAALKAGLPALDALLQLVRKVGEGTFSTVWLGTPRAHGALPAERRRWFAVKHLVPTAHPARVEHELRCLQDMGGKDNVIGVDLCLRHQDTIVFIMPYLPHKKFSEYMGLMDSAELREYLRALLRALRRVHSFGVIHRDVKPSNFLYDRDNKRYLLVDFGLAQRIGCPSPPGPGAPAAPADTRVSVPHTTPAHHAPLKRPRQTDVSPPAAKRLALDLTVGSKDKPADIAPKPLAPRTTPVVGQHIPKSAMPSPRGPGAGTCACWGAGAVCGAGGCAGRGAARACRAGTGGFRPPEVLLKCASQDTAVDMWAVGVILASVLCARYPFFRAGDDPTALAELADLLGTAPLQRTAAALGRRLLMSRERRGLCLRKLCRRLRDPPPPAPPGPVCAHCRLPQPHCLCRDPDKPADTFTPGVSVVGFPDCAFALAARLLEPHPRLRITAAQALDHPFLTGQH